MFKHKRFWRRIFTFAVASLVLAIFGTTAQAQDAATLDDVGAVAVNLDAMWILVASFLVFFMQTGFAFLEAGSIRSRGVVNSLLENYMDAAFGV
ncbi:MAG: hypothetical protein IPK19_30285 [Chloroflexi bacterium]|nr:hypothetical protein [Chloroflexota bacterium]